MKDDHQRWLVSRVISRNLNRLTIDTLCDLRTAWLVVLAEEQPKSSDHFGTSCGSTRGIKTPKRVLKDPPLFILGYLTDGFQSALSLHFRQGTSHLSSRMLTLGRNTKLACSPAEKNVQRSSSFQRTIKEEHTSFEQEAPKRLGHVHRHSIHG